MKTIVVALLVSHFAFAEPTALAAGDPYVSYVKKDSSSGSVAGKFDGKDITQEELEKTNPRILAARLEVYREQKIAMDEVVRNRVLERMAKKSGKTVDQFLKAEMIKAKKSVTDKDVDAFLLARNVPQSKKITPQFREQMRGLIHVRKLVADTTSADQAEFYLKRPRATPIDPDLSGEPAYGDKDAPFTIVEFADFQCEFCGKARERIEELKKTYGPKLRLVFKNFPLSTHTNARLAAEAGMCVNEQGGEKFWKFLDLAYDNQKALAMQDLKEYAKKAGADEKKFSSCVESKKFKDKIDDSIAEGQKMGVSATPTFVINGQILKGAQPLADFREVLEDPGN